MKKKRWFNLTIICTLILSLLSGIQAPLIGVAETDLTEYEIYPSPHHLSYNEGTVTLDSEIQVIYDQTIDDATKQKVVNIFQNNGLEAPTVGTEISDNKINLLVGTEGSDGPVDTYAKENIDKEGMDYSKIDAYQLEIKDNMITILGKDTDASFYGVVSLGAILSQSPDKIVRNLSIKDYANTKIRGFIEGFYGIPWSNEDRESLMQFGGQFKMNSYIFAPKDDPYHRAKWDEPYPEEKLEELRELAKVGNETKTRFVWTISPLGEVAHIARTQGKQAAMDLLEENTEKLLYKFDQLYDVGVRQFGVLGDDVGALPLDYVVELMDAVAKWADEKGDVYDILYCPAAYNSGWAWDGGRELNKLEAGFPDNIQIFWTGESTMGDVSQYTIDRFKTRDNNGVERRDPLFWLNWPVNDYEMSQVFLGKGEMLEPGIENLAGVVTNPMQEAEASKVSIFAVADYTWNTESFNDEKSWNDSMKYVEPNATEAFHTLAKHMSEADSVIQLEESEDIKDLLNTITTKINDGDSIKDEAPLLIEELQEIADAGDEFLATTKNEDLKEELEPFVKALRDMVLADIEYLDASIGVEDGDKEAVWNSYSRASALRAQSLNYDRPLIDGTMKAKPAAKRLQPFTNNLENQIATQFEEAMDMQKKKNAASIFTNVEEYKDLPLTEELAMTTIDGTNKVTLDSNEYVGVKLSRIKDVTSIEAPSIEGITLQSSLNGMEWNTVKDATETQDARYVRLINKGSESITFSLDNFKVLSYEVEEKSVLETNLGFWESSPLNLLDGDLSTYTWTDSAQSKGQHITYDLGQVIPLESLKLYVGEGEGDFPRHAVIEASLDGEKWDTVMTIGNQDGPNAGEETDEDGVADVFTNLEVPYRYKEVRNLDKNAKFLRFKITRTKVGTGNWLKMQEIVINDGELFPEINDPTITTESDASIGRGVENIIDGKLTTKFKPTNEDAGEVLYHVGEVEKEITGITLLEDPTKLSNGTVSVRTTDGWTELGTVDSGYSYYDTSDIENILDIKIEWEDGKAPTIHEIKVEKIKKDNEDEQEIPLVGGEIPENVKAYDRNDWSYTASSSYAQSPIEQMFDGDQSTHWHSDWTGDTPMEWPYDVEVDLGEKLTLEGFSYLPRQDKSYTGKNQYNGRVNVFELYAGNSSEDAVLVMRAEMDWNDGDDFDNTVKYVNFEEPVEASYINFRIVSAGADVDQELGSGAEFNLYKKNVVDKSALTNKVQEATSIDTTNKTEASVQVLEEAITDAEVVLANDTASQEEIDKAVRYLDEAIKQLEEKPEEVEVDKSKLEKTVSIAKEKVESDFTVDSWKTFATALAEANELLDKDKATQEAVDDAVSTLEKAIKQLEKKAEEVDVDKSELEKAISVAQEKVESDYTVDSWNGFATALLAANEILGKDEVSQEEVDQATSHLNQALSALTNVSDNVNDLDEDKELPDTASDIFNFLLVGMLLLVIGSLVFMFKKKYN
ncbi:beta-N-acetylglucosaminidase domain-containing protein [Paraliobacillus sp. PM-2]|uniref:beta-N-acetylglucosaminidase domain-containing protein n=1 Tax=Paraliobacillus sp. PM-2 TaxID=1462524 RepID=UPI0020FFFEBD|nr:beta-N-acetylglucosaminidase domain-containing protein [Paraliobacillus sp. PM-2]